MRFNESPYLSPLIELHGGVTAVAAALGVARPTVSLVKSGEAALGQTRGAALLTHLAVPDGRPADGILHVWRDRADFAATRLASRLFFPDGAEMQVAPWSRWNWSGRQLRQQLRLLPEVAVLRSGRRAVLLRTPAGRCAKPELLGSEFRWAGGGADPVELAIPDADAELWTESHPSWWDLVAAWDKKQSGDGIEAWQPVDEVGLA
jgi:hypothetical protein